MSRQHDADLCERIRELEDRVKALEGRYVDNSPVSIFDGNTWDLSGTPTIDMVGSQLVITGKAS